MIGTSKIETHIIFTENYLAKENVGEYFIKYCSYFGCGKQLTLKEKLCGDKCTRHSKPIVKTFFNGLL